MLKKYARDGGQGGIWVTELGTAAYMFEPLPRREADFMVARTVAPLYLLGKLGAGETPIRLFFFTSQYGAGGFSGGEHHLWDSSGGSPAPRPALVAFSAMAHFVEDSRLLGDIYAASKASWALHFLKPDGTSVVVFWPEQDPSGAIDAVHAPAPSGGRAKWFCPRRTSRSTTTWGARFGRREGGQLHVPIQTWEVRYLVSRLPSNEVRRSFLAARLVGLPALRVNPRSFDAPLGR